MKETSLQSLAWWKKVSPARLCGEHLSDPHRKSYRAVLAGGFGATPFDDCETTQARNRWADPRESPP